MPTHTFYDTIPCMSVRVHTGLSTQSNVSTNLQSSSSARSAPPVQTQIQEVLFGRPKPAILDIAQFPHLASIMALLNRYRKKLAFMAGDSENDYQIVLANDTIAMIDEQGTIYVGAGFLAAHANNLPVLIGVLAHEIGHRPKRWKDLRLSVRKQLTLQEKNEICQYEETRADMFAGKALAELGLPYEPLVTFLKHVQQQPHPEYFSADVRASIIQEAFDDRAYRVQHRKRLFPQYERMNDIKNHIGEN